MSAHRSARKGGRKKFGQNIEGRIIPDSVVKCTLLISPSIKKYSSEILSTRLKLDWAMYQ